MKTMNYIKIGIASSILSIAAGCTSFLEEDLKSSLAPDNTYTSSLGFEVGATGLYAIARSEYNTWGENGAFMHNGACAYEVLQISTDLCRMGTVRDGSLVPFAEMTLNPSTLFVGSYWNWAYNLIASANELLIYSEKNDNVKEGKLTTWAARHLLSEMYLLRGAEGDYKLAEENAQDVIDCPYYSLMKSRFGNAKNDPGDYFSDMFVENNQNRSAGNTEGIWVMQFQYNTVGGGTNSDDWTRRAWNPQYHAIDGFALADSLGGRGLAQIYPLKWWIGVKGTNATTAGEKEGFPDIQEKGIFEDGDIRNSEYNIKRNWYYNNPLTPNKLGQKCPIDDKSWSQAQLFPALKKFFFGKEENLQLTGAYKDRMKFRLAETYLLLAEAYLRQDMPDKAADAVNEVRRRAKVSDVSDEEMTMDFLLDERIRELYGEESRRFTLIRTGKLLERVRKYNPEARDLIQDFHVLWPIPQAIRDANVGNFPQNPGYEGYEG